MRRTVASVLVTLGLLSASLAWWSFAARFTILDPGRSGRIADVLVDQPVIRDAVAEGLSTALRQALPAGSPVSPTEIDAVAHKALEDPRALQALRTAIVDSHQRLVGNDNGPVHLDVSPIAAAGRDALLAARPDLASALPEAPLPSVRGALLFGAAWLMLGSVAASSPSLVMVATSLLSICVVTRVPHLSADTS